MYFMITIDFRFKYQYQYQVCISCTYHLNFLFYFRCVFIMDKGAPAFSLDDPFYKVQLKKDLALNVYKNKAWGSYRHLLLKPLSVIEVNHCAINTTVRGDLSSLKWLAGSLVPYTKNPEESRILHVYYAALNFKDIMVATAKLAPEVLARGRINQESVIGFEYAGRNEKGERIMGMVTTRGLSNLLVYDENLLWKIPDHWSMEEAATVPVTYGTVCCTRLRLSDFNINALNVFR